MRTRHYISLFVCLAGLNVWGLEPNSDSIYEISTGDELKEFSLLVNGGKTDAKALLKNDIDMQSISDFAPIGTSDHPFCGTFDGQGFTISNLHVTGGDYAGLIGCVVGDATVQNLILDSSCSISGGKYVGLIGGTNGEGTLIMRGLGNEATITGTGANAGGVLGSNHGSKSVIILEYCYNTGNITGGKESAAVCGWLGSGKAGSNVTSCFNIGNVTGYKTEETYVLRGSADQITNIFSTKGLQGRIVSDEVVASGELAWMLNNKSFLNPKYFQTIDSDPHPVLFSDHEVVYTCRGGYASFNPSNESSWRRAFSDIKEEEADLVENAIACQMLLDEYAAIIQSWINYNTFEDFASDYEKAQPLKNEIGISIAAYQTYLATCESALTYLKENNINSQARTVLETYLNTSAGPSETFPRGTALYIEETHLLNNEEIVSETAFLETLWDRVKGNVITSGSEVFVLYNGKFTDGLNGWTVQALRGTYGTDNTAEMPIMQTANNKSISITQTITDVPNGIYELRTNGYFSSASDGTSSLLAGQLSLNDNINYLMTLMEDTEGAVPTNVNEFSAAFIAGRYLNYTAVEVTDNTLTVGISNPGTGVANDWLAAANVRLFFWGTADEASESLDKVLNGYVARAQTLIAFVPTTDSETFHTHPNFSSALKNQLTETINACSSASTGADKMALINTFSQLFKQVHACRMAYVAMGDAAEGA